MGQALSDAELRQLREAHHILQVELSASALAIKREYRRLARQWHPDKWPAGSPQQARALEKMKEINVAYDLVRHAPLRYDAGSQAQARSRPSAGAGGVATIAAADYVPWPADYVGMGVRFVCGTFFGFIVGLFVAVIDVPRASVYIWVAPLLCGVLAVRFGDNFWYFVVRIFFWIR